MRGEIALELPAEELALLRALLARSGEVVSLAELGYALGTVRGKHTLPAIGLQRVSHPSKSACNLRNTLSAWTGAATALQPLRNRAELAVERVATAGDSAFFDRV